MDRHKPQPMDRELFQKEVIENKKTCLICFMAPWSEPSREMEDTIVEVTHLWYGTVPVYVIDPDEEPFIMDKYSVAAVPAYIMFKNGEPGPKVVGIRTAEPINNYVASSM